MICKINPNTNQIYATYPSIQEAARHIIAKKKHTKSFEVARKRISECVNGKKKTTFGFKWVKI